MNMQACDRCHRRKSKCDKLAPVCGPCRKAGVACRYIDRTNERRELVERLQRRLKQVEATNRALSAKLAARSYERPAADAVEENGDLHGSSLSDEDTTVGEPKERQNNEVTEEVSFLSLRAGGERHFLGSASGVLFANLVNSTVEVTTRGHRQHGRSVKEGAAAPAIFSPTATSIPAETPSLPSERVARDLHQAYFEHDHLPYPFLHRASVLSALDQAYTDPSFHERDAFAAFVFGMILAIATVSVHRCNLETFPMAEGYQLHAAQRLHEVLQGGGIKALQAMLLLCQYRMISSVQDNSTSLWHIVGIAARMCFELGLHREQVYRASKYPITMEYSAFDQIISNEVCRRCFWCVVAMDRILSITLGRPLAIRLQDTDVALPDQNLDSAMMAWNQGAPDDGTPDFCRTALFNHIISYRVICGNILSSLHNGTTRTQTDEGSALAARNKFAAELAQWHRDTARLDLPDVDLSSSCLGDRSSFRSREWYEMLYHNGLLMLYRPSPALSAVSSRDPIILQTIFAAAKQSITLYAHLHRSRRINYTWITLHAVFMAGLSYIYAAGRHFRSHKRGTNDSTGPILEKDPTIIEIVNDSRACSTVLAAISERWNPTKHCHDVFNRLSDAVLTDAVEYHTKGARINSLETNRQTFESPSTQDAAARFPGADGLGRSWNTAEMNLSPLAVDAVLHDCFDDLQSFQMYGCGDDPIGQLSHDWLGEIEAVPLHLASMWQS